MNSFIVCSKIAADVEIREFCTIRDSLLRRGVRVYERVSIKKSVLGEGVDINAGTYIENAVISYGVQIGPNCSIVGVYHKIEGEGASLDDTFKEIEIEPWAWLGAGCIVLPGVRIGKRAVIGAGAIVTKDVPAKHILRGIPPHQTLKRIS